MVRVKCRIMSVPHAGRGGILRKPRNAHLRGHRNKGRVWVCNEQSVAPFTTLEVGAKQGQRDRGGVLHSSLLTSLLLCEDVLIERVRSKTSDS